MTESIVLTVCREHKIKPDDFFNPKKRKRRLVKARLVAIHRLDDAGFSMAGISRMMRRHYDTIRYWMHPDYRDYKKRAASNFIAARKGCPCNDKIAS